MGQKLFVLLLGNAQENLPTFLNLHILYK